VADNLHCLIDGVFHELDNKTFLLAARMHQQLHRHQPARYTCPRRCRKHSFNVLIEDLVSDQDCDAWLSMTNFCVSIESIGSS
jgi:hypothetical protein